MTKHRPAIALPPIRIGFALWRYKAVQNGVEYYRGQQRALTHFINKLWIVGLPACGLFEYNRDNG